MAQDSASAVPGAITEEGLCRTKNMDMQQSLEFIYLMPKTPPLLALNKLCTSLRINILQATSSSSSSYQTILYFKRELRTVPTGLNRPPATPTTSVAAVRIALSAPSEPASEPAMLKAKPVTGATNGRTSDRTAEISGAIKDFTSMEYVSSSETMSEREAYQLRHFRQESQEWW